MAQGNFEKVNLPQDGALKIRGLRKVFGNSKIAVDRVDMTMY